MSNMPKYQNDKNVKISTNIEIPKCQQCQNIEMPKMSEYQNAKNDKISKYQNQNTQIPKSQNINITQYRKSKYQHTKISKYPNN